MTSRNFSGGISTATIKTAILLLLTLNLQWTIVSYVVNQGSMEGIFSASRIFLSFFIFYFFLRRLNRNLIENIIVNFAVINAILVMLQIFEALNGLDFLPVVLKYGGLWGFHSTHDYEAIRKGGVFPSLQTSSIVSLLGLFILNKNNQDTRPRYFVNILLLQSLFFGSRTVLLIGSLFLLFFLFLKRQKRVLLLLLVFAIGFFVVPKEYYSGRIVPAAKVFFTLSTDKDPSTVYLPSLYRISNDFKTMVFGNGCPRFSACGGSDPLYTRWFIQSGVPSAILLLGCLLLCFVLEFKATKTKGIFTAFLIIHGLKDEVITSFVFFDVYMAYLFAKSQEYANKNLNAKSMLTKFFE